MGKRIRRIAAAGYATLLAVALFMLAWVSLTDRLAPASYEEQPRLVTEAVVQVGDGTPYDILLPAKLSGLAPRTPVTLVASVQAQRGDSLLIKSVFAPMRLFMDDALIYESGQAGSYPAYMNDPPTIITTVPLSDRGGTAELRVEYLSLTQRGALSLPAFVVGNETALLAGLFRENGASLLFSLILIFIGFAMALISLSAISRVSSGSPFLWLGLFSLSAGVWVLGECDLTAFVLPYPVLLYNMAYMGLFLVTIPFLCFGLVVLNPKSRRPFQIMLGVHIVSATAAVSLQFLGAMDFTKSLYWFHIITPLGFVVFAGCLLWERFQHHNPAAKRFAPAVVLLTASTVLELANYWLRLTNVLTVFFQLGVLSFVIALGLVSGYYVRDSLRTAAEKSWLEYEMSAINRQLELQRMQYRKMADNDGAIKAQRHDLRHQLAVIRELNEKGSSDKLADYLNTLILKIPSGQEQRFCENYAINAVAAHYVSMARQGGAEASVQLAIPVQLPAALEIDLCVIMGNLMENAAEACTRMTGEQRFVNVKGFCQRHVLTLAVDNSFDGTVRQKDGVFLSSKGACGGTGLISVNAVAQKYGGAARFEASGNIFSASVYIKVASTDFLP